jgi:multiple sugar transport system ATP-binding protein
MSFALRSVTKRFGLRTLALRDITLNVRDQEFIVLYGPAGAGKSTILNILAGITKPTSGDVLQDGRSVLGVPPERRNAAMAFENYALYSHLSVFENLAFPLRARGMAEADIKSRVSKISDVLGISHVLDRRPGFLSGGQKQRVALGRAIIRPADIYLLDEPIGHLDAKLRHRMRAELKALAQDMKSTVVFTTTSSREALGLADRIAIINGGRVHQIGTPEEVYRKPANAFVATFVGDPPMSLIRTRVRQEGGAILLVTLSGHVLGQAPPAIAPGVHGFGDLRVGVRSNEIRLVTPGGPGVIPGRVTTVEHLGYADIAIVDVDGDQVSITTRSDQRLSHGEMVGLSFGSGAIHVFDGDRAVYHASGKA